MVEQGAWRCYAHPAQTDALSEINDLNHLIERLNRLPITLKDNHRSLVKRGELFDMDVVAKQPRDKHRRKWARLASLFTAGEATLTIQNLSKLQTAGIQSVAPVFALEKRLKGMIVDSWLCYQYRSGTPCNRDDLEKVAHMLDQMHRAGFRHGDPMLNNFLIDQSDQTLFTIDTKAKPCWGSFAATMDFILLKRANKLYDVKLSDLTSLDKARLGYWLAVLYFQIKSGRAKLRDLIRKNRPKNG